MNKYEISLWEDYPDTTEDGVSFLNERKLCVIGSDTMTSSIRACEPKFVENINGTHTFTFKMFYTYLDEYTGEQINNPFRALLVNERKVKVFWKDDWYDLIIKNIDDDSNSNSATYTCKDLFITELSKNGYNIELTSDLQNNSGTASELAGLVLDNSGWIFDNNNSDKIYQQQEESVYEATTVGEIIVSTVSPNSASSDFTISNNKKVLIFKSSIDAIPDNPTNFTTKIQLLYTNENQFATDTNEMLVINGLEGEFEATVTKLSGQRRFQLTANNGSYVIVSANDGISTNFRAKRYIQSQRTQYDDILKRYVNIFSDNRTNELIYGFSGLEFSSPQLVINLIANASDFSSVNGWFKTNQSTDHNDLTWTVYPPFDSSTTQQLSEYSGRGYLKLSSGSYYNSGLSSNLSYFQPNQRELKQGNVGGFIIGETYIFRIKIRSVGTDDTVGSYITTDPSKLNLDIKKFNKNDYSPEGQSYFELEDSSVNNNWTEYSYKCIKSCPASEIETLGFFVNSQISCWVEEIQFFKYATGIDENGIEKRINPGDINLSSTSKIVYKYYKINNAATPEELDFVYKDSIPSPLYEPLMTYEKITTVEAKGSNRFNILQFIAENFECWVKFIINHDSEGHIILNEETGLPEKYVRLVNQVGNDLGWSFTYGIDLKNIKRKVASENLATKVIVLSNNNEFGKNGFCTIARSQLNYSKETFILNLDYYINQGLLDRHILDLDLYSSDSDYIGYFYNLNKKNSEYDNIISELSQINKDLLHQQSEREFLQNEKTSIMAEITERQSDVMQLCKVSNLEAVNSYTNKNPNNEKVNELIKLLGQLNTNLISTSNKLNTLEQAISNLETKQLTFINQQKALIESINDLHNNFYKKYARYIQEGTWQDENYIDDDKYYLDGLQVAYTSSRPQVSYDINIVRLNYLEDYSSKKFSTGDLCYVEDKEFFNFVTTDGTPYKLKIVISEITSFFDTPEKDTIKVQNYKTQFDDLFQRITATTQSLQYAQGSYAKAASVINQDKTFNFDLLQETFDYNKSLVLNASNQDVTWGQNGITINDSNNSMQKLRIMSGGLFVSSDGGETWKNAIRGDGISTDLLTAGRINAGEVYIYSGTQPTFKWDENGITAYKYNTTNNTIDYNTFVRHDQYGLYGYSGSINDSEFIPNNINDIKTNATFGLTWDGFFMKANDGTGSITINSNDSDGDVIKCINNNKTTFALNKNGSAMIGNWLVTSPKLQPWGQPLYWNNQCPSGALVGLDKTNTSSPVYSISGQLFGWRNGDVNSKIGDKSALVPFTGIYISPVDNDKAVIKKPGLPQTEDNNFKSDWRLIIGSKFAVDSSGNVYASNLSLTGNITWYNNNPVNKNAVFNVFDTSSATPDGIYNNNGKLYIKADNISAGILNAGQVVFQAYQTDDTTKGGGFKCAIGHTINALGEYVETYGAMMYGGTTGKNFFIATDGGVRMTAGNNDSSSDIWCSPNHASINSSNVTINGKAFDSSTGMFTGSDRNKKHDISYNIKKYEEFYKSLKPAYFKLNNGTSDRYHIGFIAQDVREALLNNNLTTQDFAGFGILKFNNEPEFQALRYEEFISLNTYMIQKLTKQIEDLQQEIENLK